MNDLNQTFKENWEKLKGKVKNQWNKLSDEELDQINGSYKKLKNKLQEVYHYKAAEVEDKIEEFIDSPALKDITNDAKKVMHDTKQLVTSALEDYFKSVKHTSFDIEKSIVDYASKNPFKVAGILGFAGFLAGCIYKNATKN